MSIGLGSNSIASYVRSLILQSAAQQAQALAAGPALPLATVAQPEATRLEAGIMQRLALLSRLSGGGGVGAGYVPPASMGLGGALPGFGLSLGPQGWPANTIGTAGGYRILPGLGFGGGGFGVFGPGQSFGDTPWLSGQAGPTILGDGTRILMDAIAQAMNVVNGADRATITGLGGATPQISPFVSDGLQWIAQNWAQNAAPQNPLPLGTPDWQNALANAGAPSCFDALAQLRQLMLSGTQCQQQLSSALIPGAFNPIGAPGAFNPIGAPINGPAPIGGCFGPPAQPQKVYVFGNRDYPISTTKSSQKQVDLSKSLAQEFGQNGFDGLFNKLGPDGQAVSQNYGAMFGKSVVYGENGQLIGVYDTKELEKLNADYPLYGNSTAKGKTLKTPDGRQLEIADNRFASPLAFDLDGNGIKTTAQTVKYDIDGDGKVDTINNVNEGILAIRGGKNGKDLFGNNTDLDGDGKADGYANGFDALRGLGEKAGLINVAKGDTKLDANDLALLEKQYGLGMKQGYDGQVRSLKDLGVTQIDLSQAQAQAKDNFDGQGNRLQTQAGATFTVNGQKRTYADVWHQKKTV